MAQRASISMSRPSIDSTTSELSEVSDSLLGSNTSSVAYLVYANRGDAYSAGYKAPTTRDIPQIKLPRVEQPENPAQIIDKAKKLAILGGSSGSDGTSPGETSPRSPFGDAVGGSDGNTSTSKGKSLKDEKVPAIFSSDNFKLDNPRVFDEVIGEGDSTLIQEKLSWYIDIVEAQLEHEIASSSTQFFNATTQFAQIQSQAVATTEKISNFSKIAEKQHEIVQYQQNTALIKEKLASARKISEALDIIEELSRLTDAAEAKPNHFDALLEAQQFVAEKKSNGIDLSRAIAAQPFLERLETAEVVMRKNAAANYAAAMISELKADAATRGKPAHILNGNREADEALHVADKLGARELAFEIYSQEINHEVKRVIKSHMPNDRESSSQPLARALHDLSHEEANKMYTTMFEEVINLLQALSRQVHKYSSKNDSVSDNFRSQSIILDTVRDADSRIVKVLRVRKDPVTALTVPEFLEFSAQVHNFCTAAKDITKGEAETTVLEFLVAQTKLYIHTIHTAAEEELAHAMDSDDWKRTEVRIEAQKKVDMIANSALADPHLKPESNSEDASKEPTKAPSDASSPVKRAKSSTSRVLLDSDAFLVSKSTLQLVSLIIPYVQLSCGLPVQQLDSISTSLLELLRGYNNRLHHLVLQHGATKTAGLKHISVRNLIFAFECLRFVEALLDPIKQCLKRHYQGNFSQLSASFDSVQQLLFDHRSEIQRKLVKLMNDKASAYTRYISTIDWSEPITERPASKNNIVELMRQTVTVVHVAQEMMSPEQSKHIVQEIYAVYKQKFLEVYSNVQVNTVKEKQNVLHDLVYFKQKSEHIQGAGNTADVVYESVNGFVAPDLPEIDQNLSLAPEEPSAPRGSLEVPEADASIAYMPDETMHDEVETENSGTDKNVLPNSNPPSTDITDKESEVPSRVASVEPEISGKESEFVANSNKGDATTSSVNLDKINPSEQPQKSEATSEETKEVPSEIPSADDKGEEANVSNVSGGDLDSQNNKPSGKEADAELDEAKFAADKAKAERIEAERIEAEKLEKEKLEAEKLEKEKLEREKLEAEKLEAEKLEAAKVEAERVETAKADERKPKEPVNDKGEKSDSEKSSSEDKTGDNEKSATETGGESTTATVDSQVTNGGEGETTKQEKVEDKEGLEVEKDQKPSGASDSMNSPENATASNSASSAPKPKKNNNNKKKNKKNKKK